MDRIALAVGADGKLADFFSIIKILIYEKQSNWSVADCIWVKRDTDTSLTAKVRQKAEEMANDIQSRNCNSVVGREIIGIPYHTWIRAGLEVFEADEISDNLFEEIYHDFFINKDGKTEEEEIVLPRPVPSDDEGNYFLDFIKAEKCHPELSSKKMLLPFLMNDLFFSLRIRCEHLMPWLEEFTKTQGLNIEAKKEDGICHVLITHKNCSE